MWVSLRNNALAALGACAVLAGPAAWADDLLVMPYACSVRNGQPILRRVREDEGHRILGRREQRTVTACSPVNPDMCRRWTAYRFDLDCDGARVPWISVVAEAARYDGVWIEGGRLRLDMGPRWSLSPDDPCARTPAFDNPWRSRAFRRFCAERREMIGSSTVDMPPGFAPMLGIDAIFVAGGAPSVAAVPRPAQRHDMREPASKGWEVERVLPPEPAAKGAHAAHPEAPAPAAGGDRRAKPSGPPAPPPDEKSARAAKPPSVLPELAAKDARIKSLQPAAHQPAQSASNREAAPSAPVAATKQAKSKHPEAKPAPPPSPAPAANAGGPVIPRIINRPDAKRDAASPQANTKLALAPTMPPKKALAQDSPVEKAAVKRHEDAPLTLMSIIRSPATEGVIVVGTFAVLLLAAFALTRRRERAQLAGAPTRDIATVSLGASATSSPSVPAKSNPQVWAQEQRSPTQPAPAEKPTMLSNWGDRIPSTREEALQVLGMGVSPDANLNAIKKIVDGLRASWHPDHASAGADRQMRELRLKQINAAWEIIAGKRAAV